MGKADINEQKLEQGEKMTQNKRGAGVKLQWLNLLEDQGDHLGIQGSIIWKVGGRLGHVLQGAHSRLCSGNANTLMVSFSHNTCMCGCMHATRGAYAHVRPRQWACMNMSCPHVCVCVPVHVCDWRCACVWVCASVHMLRAIWQTFLQSPAALPLLTKIESSNLGQEVKPMLLLLVTGEVI